MLRENLWQEIQPQVVHPGHYIFSSRLHGDKHSNFASGLLSPAVRTMLVNECLAETQVMHLGRWDELVVVGTGCGYWYAAMVAERLGSPSVYAERSRFGHFALRRDQAQVVQGKNILLLDDVLSTGASAVHLSEMLVTCRANLAGALFLLDRGNPLTTNWVFAHPHAVPVHALFYEPMQTWAREECPLCRDGVPFSTQYGKGEDEMFLHGQPQKS